MIKFQFSNGLLDFRFTLSIEFCLYFGICILCFIKYLFI